MEKEQQTHDRRDFIAKAIGYGTAATGLSAVLSKDVYAQINNNNVIALDNLNELRASSPSTITSGIVFVKSHTNQGDGGHGHFRYVSGPTSGVFVDDFGTTILPTGGDGSTAWLRVDTGVINVRWFGAQGDALTDDLSAFNAAINYAEHVGREGGVVFVPNGDYILNGVLRIGGWVALTGDTVFSSSLIFPETHAVGNCIELGPDMSGVFGFSGAYTFGSRLVNLDINAKSTYRGANSAVVYTNGAHQPSGIFQCQIRNVVSIAIRHALGDGGPANFTIEDVNIVGSENGPSLGDKIGIWCDAAGAQVNINRVQIESSATHPFDYGIRMSKDHLNARDVHFENCTIGILLQQNELNNIRHNTIINATGNSTVPTLINRSQTNNNTLIAINVTNQSIDPQFNLKVIDDAVTGFHITNSNVSFYDSEGYKKESTPLSSNLVIVSGAIHKTHSYHGIDTENLISVDNLETINGGADGDILRIRRLSIIRTVVVKHNTGNIWCKDKVDVSLNDREQIMEFIFDSNIGKWLEM